MNNETTFSFSRDSSRDLSRIKLIFCTGFGRITAGLREKRFNAEWKYVSPINVIPNFFPPRGDSHQ